MNKKNLENIILAIFVLIGIELFMLAVVIIDKPIILVKHINETCDCNKPIDTSYGSPYYYYNCAGFYCSNPNSVYVQGLGTCYKQNNGDIYCPR